MTFHRPKRKFGAFSALTATLLAAAPAHAEMSAEELAKLAQNPVGNLISVPFQNNTNLNVGPDKRTQNILNIQPVIPISVSDEWNIITRTIVPVISQPLPDGERTNGIGDTVFTAFLSPAKPGQLHLGCRAGGATADQQQFGPRQPELGSRSIGRGLHLEKGNPWVYGVLVNNIWSLSDSGTGGSYNNGLIQPFVNYNFDGGFYITSAPIITANWKAESSQRWTVPVGGGVGKIFHLGPLPVNTQLSAYYNVVTPDNGPNWQIRAQVQFMFPK